MATDRRISVIAQNGLTVRELPRGVPSPDWSASYIVEPVNTTSVRVLDPTTGVERRTISVPGRYELSTAYRVAPTGLSRSGAQLTLEAAPKPTESGVAVVDTRSDSVKTVATPGEQLWALDAMSGQPLATLAVPVATSIARVR